MGATDDGVKAAATSSMCTLVGIEGKYDERSACYNPPEGFRDWNQLVQKRNIKLDTSVNLFADGQGNDDDDLNDFGEDEDASFECIAGPEVQKIGLVFSSMAPQD